MANYLVMFSAPAAHIHFMRQHSGISRDYYVGEPPVFESPEPPKRSFLDKLLGRNTTQQTPAPIETPNDWPTTDADVIDMEINHRNVDLYHWILNQTNQPVSGAGSIFQTWITKEHDAIPLDTYGEDFAFLPDMLPELLTRVEAVTPETLRQAFHAWCQERGQDHEPTLDEATEMHQEFRHFADYLNVAIAKKQGLVWVVS